MRPAANHIISPHDPGRRSGSRALLGALLLVAAGLVVGWPTLRGGYLSGDDEQLVMNHALVNHPSLGHAVTLFRILHRDLYQPLPLLTFQVQFALHGGTVWLLHLGNVLLHIGTGLLIWRFLVRLVGGHLSPLLAALLFLLHPLNAECLAWLNGRMIMMNTAFTILTVMAFDRWSEPLWSPPAGRHRPAGWLGAGVTLLAGVAAMISKAWITLPLLLLLLPLWRRYRPNRRWWALWGVLLAVTAGFVYLNVGATDASGLFEGAEKQLHGPVPARMLLALGWYVTHYFWPAGLSPYYAPPKEIAWTDGGVLLGLAVLGAMVPIAVASWRRTRVTALGLGWFLVAIAPGLLTVMARNLMVADRYTYLANVGLHWSVAHWLSVVLDRCTGRSRPLLGAAIAGLALALATVSRLTASYYHDDDAKIKRVLACFPDHPTLLTTSGWFHFERGDYEGALRLANEELARFRDDAVAYYRAKNLRAIAEYYRSGDLAAAEHDLRDAIAAAPEYAKSYYRLGMIYHDRGRDAEAVSLLETAIEKAPGFNPAINLLARIYRQQNRLDLAAEWYRKALDSAHGYDVAAINALGEIEIERGDYESAVGRYRDLLAWHPLDVRARINLALAWRLLGRDREAAAECDYLLANHPGDLRALVAATDYLRTRQRYRDAAAVWSQALAAEPQRQDLQAWTALHQWYAGDLAATRRLLGQVPEPGPPIAPLVRLLLAVREGREAEVLQGTADWSDGPVGFGAARSTYALEALEFAAQLEPESPWPYYVTAAVLLAKRQFALAQAFREGFAARSRAPEAHRQLDTLFESATAGSPHE